MARSAGTAPPPLPGLLPKRASPVPDRDSRAAMIAPAAARYKTARGYEPSTLYIPAAC